MVVELNPAIRYGDQISFIRMTQMTNASTGVPYVIVREYEVVIDTNNLLPLSNYLPVDLITTWGGDPAYLAVGIAAGRSGGFAMILSRTISGKTYVSSQRIIPVAMDAYIEAFSSQAALQAAINSYGVSEDAFLSSTYAAQDNQAPTTLALLGSAYQAGDLVPAGARFVIPELQPEEQFSFFFNGTLDTVPSSAILNTNKGIITLESLSKLGSKGVGNLPASMDVLTNVVIYQAFITVDSSEYSLSYLVRNEDSVEGIE